MQPIFESPYKISVFTFTVCLLLAGFLQDKVAPKKVSMFGVSFVGGLILARIGRVNAHVLIHMLKVSNMVLFTKITAQIPLMVRIVIGAMPCGASVFRHYSL